MAHFGSIGGREDVAHDPHTEHARSEEQDRLRNCTVQLLFINEPGSGGESLMIFDWIIIAGAIFMF